MSILEWVAALVAILAWPAALTACVIIIGREIRKSREDQ